MAVQSNDITVVDVYDGSMVIRFFVGHLDITLRYQPQWNRFLELSRLFIDGRRWRDPKYLRRGRYTAMIQQAHAIARDHGWKQAQQEAQ